MESAMKQLEFARHQVGHRTGPIAPTPWSVDDQIDRQCVCYVVDANGETVCEVWDLPMGHALPIALRIVAAVNGGES